MAGNRLLVEVYHPDFAINPKYGSRTKGVWLKSDGTSLTAELEERAIAVAASRYRGVTGDWPDTDLAEVVLIGYRDTRRVWHSADEDPIAPTKLKSCVLCSSVVSIHANICPVCRCNPDDGSITEPIKSAEPETQTQTPIDEEYFDPFEDD